MYLIFVIFVFLLAVLQDYIYSSVQKTGFYLSESLLYNSFWILFIPFTILINRLINIIDPKNEWNNLPLNLGVGIAFSLIHILFFAAVFVLISNLAFSPPHRFSTIFNTALSNQFYIAVLWYTIFPALYSLKYRSTNSTKRYPEKTKLKIGTKIITIPTASI